jgi:hypothetical protein
MGVAGHTREGSPRPHDRRDTRGRDGDGSRAGDDRPAEFRYGAVFMLVFALVVFLIVAPTAEWSRGIALGLEGTALVVAVATSRVRPAARRRQARAAGLAAIFMVVGVMSGIVPVAVDFALGGAIALAIPMALAGGLMRLVRDHGVTLQAVAGTLAIYLLVGLLFAWTISCISRIGATPYFAQGGTDSMGRRVYFSFTVLTTTGFGDLTPARPVGRALAVVEMLMGQLYLVTVIGLVVGNFAGRRRS